MFGIFRRTPTPRVATRARASLRLEALEWRYQLDGTPVGDPPGGPVVAQGSGAPAPNAAPEIVDFKSEQIANGLFLITGKVIDEAPGGLTVTFGGATSASGTAVTHADGTFSWLAQLRTDGTDSGFLVATTVDAQGLESDEAMTFLSPTPTQ